MGKPFALEYLVVATDNLEYILFIRLMDNKKAYFYKLYHAH